MASDTSPEIDALYRAMFDRLTPAERFHKCGQMFDFARKLVRTGILMRNPGISEIDLQQQTFLRFYEHDLSDAMIARVLEIIADRYRDAPLPRLGRPTDSPSPNGLPHS
jgi:hypothetical protein